MSDEQTIYVSPEDDLTNVRERLERVTTRQLTLIIPTQTRLRSHVAWKVLHGDARRLGKDVLIISSDPQIRSVAQAAKFRVANSLESSSTSKSAPTSRPGRTNMGARSKGPTAQSRTSQARTPPSARRSVDLRGAAGPRSQSQDLRPGQLRPSPQWEDPLSEHTSRWQVPESEKPGAEETETGGLGKQGPSTFETFETPDKRYGRNYDFRIDTSPPILPLSPQQIEEPNLLLEDFNRAQDIRQAALQGVDEEGHPPVSPKEKTRFEGVSQNYRPTPLPQEADDPFSYMEDLQPPPKGEQRGAVSIEGFDTTEQAIRGDISDYPTNIIDGEVEYEGDLGNFAPPADKPPVTRLWNEGSPERQREPDDLPARIHGMRPRSNRSGRMPDPESADALPPVDDRPTLITQRPPQPVVMPLKGQPRPSPAPASTGSSRVGQQAPAGRNRPPQSAPTQATRNRPPALASAAQRQGQSRAEKKAAPRRTGRGSIGIAIAILLLLLAGGLAYFGPSADVTITLPATNYSHAVVLTANTAGQQSNTLHIIPAQIRTRTDFTVSGKGFKASGSQAVGQSPASGTVVFTNKGTRLVIIPTGTIVTTSGNNAINFVTMAEVVAPANGDSPAVIVQAQQAGSNSNVAGGTIVNIPETSLAAIAQNDNVDVNSLKLSVINPDKTSGGGTANVPVVTHTDIQAAHDALHKQIQSQVDAWKLQLPAGDVAGKPYITQETLLNAPVEGVKLDTSTFSATLTASAAVLVASSTAIQDGARAQLNDFLSKDSKYRSGYTVVTGSGYPVDVTQLQPHASTDGKSLTLNFTASGKIVPRVTSQQVQGLIMGKPAGEAHDLLVRQIPQAQHVDIKVYPGFVTWVTFWSGHINVTIVPGTPAKTGP